MLRCFEFVRTSFFFNRVRSCSSWTIQILCSCYQNNIYGFQQSKRTIDASTNREANKLAYIYNNECSWSSRIFDSWEEFCQIMEANPYRYHGNLETIRRFSRGVWFVRTIEMKVPLQNCRNLAGILCGTASCLETVLWRCFQNKSTSAKVPLYKKKSLISVQTDLKIHK